MAAVNSWYAIVNRCVLDLLCGTIDTNTTKSCAVNDLRTLGTSEQGISSAGIRSDLSRDRTLSELLHMGRVLLILCTRYCSY